LNSTEPDGRWITHVNSGAGAAKARSARILLVEDDPSHARLMQNSLRKIGGETHHVSTRAAALESLAQNRFDLLLLDMGLPDGNGFQIQEWLNEWPVAPRVVFVTADDLAEHAVRAMQGGATNYVVKRPNYLSQVVETVDRVLQSSARAEGPYSQSTLKTIASNLAGRSAAMVAVRRAVEETVSLTGPFLVTGESGTGRSLVSRMIHSAGDQAALKMRVIHSSELTGRFGARSLEDALRTNGIGTLVVEAIEAAGSELQFEALDLIDRGLDSSLWARGTRLVVEASRDIGQLVAAGSFDPKLASRLANHQVVLPPLRERTEDVPSIVEHEFRRLSAEVGSANLELAPDAWMPLEVHQWPGNVNELLYVIRHAASTADSVDPIEKFAIEDALRFARIEYSPRAQFERLERDRIRSALDHNDWNVSKTARALDVTRGWLRRRMQALGLGQ